MERGILDTSVLIAQGLEPIPGQLAISVVSMAELQFGILVAKSSDARAQRLARVNALHRRFDPLPMDDAVAESYGRLAARVVEIGRQPRSRVLDLMIAATALAHEAKLYTFNPDDFRGLEDLVEVVSL